MRNLLFISLFFIATAALSDEVTKCICGTYRHDFEFAGNSTNHYRIIDGTTDAALVRDTERTADKRFIMTEVQMVWPGKKMGYIPALDQLGEDGDKLCVKGKIMNETLSPNSDGVKESLTYFKYVENIYPSNTNCKGEPIRIHIDAVRKAELPR